MKEIRRSRRKGACNQPPHATPRSEFNGCSWPVSGLKSFVAPPSRNLGFQWHRDATTLSYRCGGSAGIASMWVDTHLFPVSPLENFSPLAPRTMSRFYHSQFSTVTWSVGADETTTRAETTALQGGRAKDPLLAVADGDTPFPRQSLKYGDNRTPNLIWLTVVSNANEISIQQRDQRHVAGSARGHCI